MAVVPLPPEFRLERYFAQHEFSARHLLCCSDAEALSMAELLAMANEEDLKLWNDLKLGYTESQGMELLRQVVAKTLYPNCSKDDVIVGAPQELIYMAMRCMVSPGDHVIAPFPAYQSLYANLTSIGCHVDKWEAEFVEEEDEAEKKGQRSTARWRFSLESLRRRVKATTKLVVVNFPHNPTGAVLGRTDWLRLLDFCRSRGIAVFSDEMYKYLRNDDVGGDDDNGVHDDDDNAGGGDDQNEILSPAVLPSACDAYEKAVTLFGVSKSLSLPGLRVGWLVTRDVPVMNKMKSFKDYLSICSSAPSEILSLIAVRNAMSILQKNRRLMSANLLLLDDFFAKYAQDFAFPRESFGTTTFVKIREGGPMAKALMRTERAKGSGVVEGDVKSEHGATAGIASLFCNELLRRKSVLLLPAAEYDGYDDVYFRLSFARADLAVGLKEWEDFMEEVLKIES